MYTISINGNVVYSDNDHSRALYHYSECCKHYAGSIVFKHDGIVIMERASTVVYGR